MKPRNLLLVATAAVWVSTATAQEIMYVTSNYNNVNLLTLDSATGVVQSSVPVTNEEALFGGLTCDLNMDLYSIDGYNDSLSDRTFRIDRQTGAGTVVGNTGFNWNFRCVEVHPMTGTLYGFTDNRLYTLDKSTGVATLVANVTGPTLDQATALAINGAGTAYFTDIGSTGLFTLNLTTGAGTHLGDLGLGTWLEDLSFDSTGTLWGVKSGGGMYKIDLNAVTATLQYSTPGYRGIAFKPNTCAGSIQSYGSGCAGTGGFVPLLKASGCPVAGDTVFLALSNALGPSNCFLFFGLGQTAAPMGGGCTLNVIPVLPVVLVLPVGGSGPGGGTLSLGAALPANTPTATITIQAFTNDTGGAMHFANSNGVQLNIP